jgi:hypothetical protein
MDSRTLSEETGRWPTDKVAFDAGLGEFGIALKVQFANRLIILEKYFTW